MRGMTWLAGAALVVASGPVAAQRQIEAPVGESWRHGATGVVLPARMLGMDRFRVADLTASEQDVFGIYESADKTLLGTIYIFHARLPDPAIWFDRSDTALRNRDLYQGAKPVGAPVAFVPLWGGAASGLRQVYATGGGPYRSTALAIMPLNGWLVSVRLSAKAIDAAALDPFLDQMLLAAAAAITGGAKPAPAAVPIAACATPLSFGRAKLLKPTMEDAMFGSILGLAASLPDKPAPDEATPDEAKPAATPLCRDPSSAVVYGVYRSDTPGYVIALGDSGTWISVALSAASQIEAGRKAGQMGVRMTDVEGKVSTYPSFSALPRPEQVVAVVTGSAPIATSTIGAKGNEISVAPLGGAGRR